PGGGAAPIKPRPPASFFSWKEPAGRAAPTSVPAFSASSVISAGRLRTDQFQKPEPVGESGWKMVTAEDLVRSGAPDQARCGEISWPFGTPMFPEYCAAGHSWRCVTVVDVTLNSSTSSSRAN